MIYDKPVRELMREFGISCLQRGTFFKKHDAVAWFEKNYPNIKSSTVRAHVEAMSINAVSWRVNDPALKPGQGWDLFFKVEGGVYRLWAPESDPPPVYYSTLTKNNAARRSREKIENVEARAVRSERPRINAEKRRIDDSDVLEFGSGEEAVYAYGYQSAPGYVKIGRCGGDVEKRIVSQIDTGSPGRPVLHLVIRTNASRSLEKALHGILEVRFRKLPGGGEEWFQATREEIVQIYSTIPSQTVD